MTRADGHPPDEDDGTSTGSGSAAGPGAGPAGASSVVDFGLLDDAPERAAVEVVDLDALGAVTTPPTGPPVVDFDSVAGTPGRRSPAAQPRTRSGGRAAEAPRRHPASRPLAGTPVDPGAETRTDAARRSGTGADEPDAVSGLWPAEDADPLAAGSRSADPPARTPRVRRPSSGDARRRAGGAGPDPSDAPATEPDGDASGDDVVDGSADGRSRRSGSGSFGRSGSGSGSFGKSGSGSFGKSGSGSFGRSGSGSFGKSGSSSFGDSASRLGRSSRRGASSGSKRREWGIQLDAEVEEPTPGPAPAAGSATADGTSEQSTPDVRGNRPTRTGNRGRSGSFGRPRRAEGDSPPEFEDPEQTAKQICLTALTGASRSRQQLAELLATRDIPDEVAATVLDRFTEVGLVDDAAFAAAWVSSRQSTRGLSRRALSHELRAKGIDPEVASVALEAVDPQDEWDTARVLVARKVPGMRRLDSATATRRLTGMLARKGYGMGLAAWVVREALEADGKAEDTAAEADDAAPDLSDAAPAGEGQAGDGPAVRRGLWSGRPLEQDVGGEVGEGLTVDGAARSRSAARRPGGFGRR